jgi:SAM-dependent methyltransferase
MLGGWEAPMAEEKVRFSFGKNWKGYAKRIDQKCLDAAVRALTRLLGTPDLSGKTFLDAGCGSGLSSAAALKMGADRVLAFDWDSYSVECAGHVIERLLGDKPENLELKQGSILDPEFMASLGAFDVSYSWGVLHHTGSMWQAMESVADRVAPGGVLAIAIYNRMTWNELWLKVKRLYNRCPGFIRFFFTLGLFSATALIRLCHRKNPFYKRSRGMSVWHDSASWLGGLPYEWASEGEVVAHLEPLGFALARVLQVSGFKHGANQFLLQRETSL